MNIFIIERTLDLIPTMRVRLQERRHRRSAALLTGVFVVSGLMGDAVATGKVAFRKTIAPILSTHCLECHSGDDPENGLDLSTESGLLKGGESGSVVVARDLEASLLWTLVSSDEMPPKHPLASKEKAELRNWILQGAPWEGGDLSRFAATNERRAGEDWWSLQPVKRPPLPPLSSGEELQNPIDRFVAWRRAAEGLTASPPASRGTMIRRLSFDLLGLPPGPADVERFVTDPNPRAYEDMVDRLLASPRFGERWARHWLDITRFGESHGFERDHIRLHSWRYRDWVVDALNRNLPYDEFVQLQLAGDVLKSDHPDGLVATGFLVAGAYDVVGQSQQSAAMRAVVRQDEMEDYVSTIGQTFLGLTVHCARCHDHKFDPILQREYYQLSAALAGVRPGERGIEIDTSVPRYEFRIADLERRLRAQAKPVVQEIIHARRQEPFVASTAQPVIQFDEGKFPPRPERTERGFAVVDGALWFDSREADIVIPGTSELTEKTIHFSGMLRSDISWKQRLLSLENREGETQESVWINGRGEVWLTFRGGKMKSLGRLGPSVQGAAVRPFSLVFGEDETVWLFADGQPSGKPISWRKPVSYEQDAYQLRFGGLGDGDVPPTGRSPVGLVHAQLYDWALSPMEIAQISGVISEYVSEIELGEGLGAEASRVRQDLIFERDQLRSQKSRFLTSRTYAVKPQRPKPVHLLKRGNPGDPGASVRPSGIAALKGVGLDFDLSEEASDADRRVALAHWISDAANPLFARVIVNRLWFYHFGTGLVSTPSDFGFSGGQPSHPQLLDWLAVELIERDWDLKAIHRLMVTSQTYRQSSRLRRDAQAIDAENRLLWRMNPKRLEAEGLRDAILTATGQMNGEMGGPGFQDFSTYVHNSQFYHMLDPVGETFHRRSLYRMWIRSGRSPFLDVFDCPDPSTTAPKRAVTTTPLQSLTLMNHSFVLRMSDALAQRMKDGGGGPASEVRRAFLWCFGRAPDSDEIEEAVAMIASHGRSAFARALLNSSEFLYVD